MTSPTLSLFIRIFRLNVVEISEEWRSDMSLVTDSKVLSLEMFLRSKFRDTVIVNK